MDRLRTRRDSRRPYGIVAANLQPKVVASLSNPRLLGIALELLEGAAITRLEELNVSRLLFEHIRRECEPDTAIGPQRMYEFVQRLQRDMRRKLISRVHAILIEDDLNRL